MPVFSSGEEAARFASLRAPDGGAWRVREVGPGRLLSALLGPGCAGVRRVTLDPPPEVPDEVAASLVGVVRERFVGRLRGRAFLAPRAAQSRAACPATPALAGVLRTEGSER